MFKSNRYEIIEPLGTGGMGKVYQTRDTLLDRIVALKILDQNKISDSTSRARFEREGVIISSLKHEHIVLFFAFGINEDDIPFIAMEYLEGETLRQKLNRDSALDWRHAARIFIQICDALAHAHEKGIVHRDLKPENIMLLGEGETETVKVLDFGLATIIPGSAAEMQKLTATGKLPGTMKYISPEQCSGQKADHRSDIYALGCFLFESVAGEAPFQADSDIALIAQHANVAPKSFASCGRKDLPAALERIINKSLAKNPEQRYQSMNEVKSDLQKLLAGNPELLSAATRKHFSSKLVISVFAILALLAGAAVAYKNLQKQDSEKEISKYKPIRSVDDVHELLRKEMLLPQGDIPTQTLDECLAIPNLSKPDRALLFYLRGKNADNLVFNVLCLNQLSEVERNTYPPIVLLDCLDRLENLTLKNNLYVQAKKYCEFFEKTYPELNFPTDKDKRMAHIRLINAKSRLAKIAILEGNEKYAEKELKGIEDEHHPSLLLYEALADLGQTQHVLDVAKKNVEQGDFTNGLADYFRSRGMLPELEKAITFQKRESFKSPDSLHRQLTMEQEALYWLEKVVLTKASEVIEDYIREHLDILFSNKTGTRELRPFVIGMLCFCNNRERADALVQSIYRKRRNLQNEDEQLIARMQSALTRTPAEPEARLKHFLQMARDNTHPYERLFYVSNINRDLMDNAEVPDTDKCEAVNMRRNCFRELQLPVTELRFCKILTNMKGASKNYIYNDSDDSGMSYHHAALLRSIELQLLLGKLDEAKANLARLEGSENQKIRAYLVKLHLILHNKEKARAYAEACGDPDSLRLISETYRRFAMLDEARKTIERAAKLTSTSEAVTMSVKIEHALVELESRNPEAARKIISAIDWKSLKQPGSEYNDARLYKLSLAMAFANMEKEALAMCNYRQELQEARLFRRRKI